ncbi:MAG: Gx transporter family protein [Oscillospiraceae bacterium]|jgi:heptaprenyl diphosphate synthase|nr:Gx transporter family protein [Oscillospiraceae bacterium]
MSAKRICIVALFVGVALAVYVIESAVPVLLPVPGARLGLANVVVLWLVFVEGGGVKTAFAVFFVRVLLSGLMFSGVSAALYSFVGGLCAFAVEAFLASAVAKNRIAAIPVGVCAAIFHNVGQLVVAAIMLGGYAVFVYFPVLLAAGAVAGAATGLCVYLLLGSSALNRLSRL